MLKLVDQYLLRRIIATSLVMTGVGLAVLLLERLLRLFGLVANPSKAFSFVGQMLVLLTPHYLSVALPAAFFFGVLLTFLRLRQDNELVVLSSVGQGLHRLIAPAMALAVVMTATAILILGYLNPHARYAYRALKNSVAEASLNAAVREGTFIQADGLTFFAEGSVAGSDGLQLSKVFVYEETSDGTSIVTTGTQGLLGQTGEDTGTILKLKDGVRAELPAGDGDARTLTFTDLSWPVATGEVAEFRPRGRDQRELTLPELWSAKALGRQPAQRRGDRGRAQRQAGDHRHRAVAAAARGIARAGRRPAQRAPGRPVHRAGDPDRLLRDAELRRGAGQERHAVFGNRAVAALPVPGRRHRLPLCTGLARSLAEAAAPAASLVAGAGTGGLSTALRWSGRSAATCRACI